jgi:hypothetical protein
MEWLLAETQPPIVRANEAAFVKEMALGYDRAADLCRIETILNWCPEKQAHLLPRDRVISRLWEALRENRVVSQQFGSRRFGRDALRLIRRAYIAERLARLRDRAVVHAAERELMLEVAA